MWKKYQNVCYNIENVRMKCHGIVRAREQVQFVMNNERYAQTLIEVKNERKKQDKMHRNYNSSARNL